MLVKPSTTFSTKSSTSLSTKARPESTPHVNAQNMTSSLKSMLLSPFPCLTVGLTMLGL